MESYSLRNHIAYGIIQLEKFASFEALWNNLIYDQKQIFSILKAVANYFHIKLSYKPLKFSVNFAVGVDESFLIWTISFFMKTKKKF